MPTFALGARRESVNNINAQTAKKITSEAIFNFFY
jgi:hypothetical protein